MGPTLSKSHKMSVGKPFIYTGKKQSSNLAKRLIPEIPVAIAYQFTITFFK